MLLWEFITFCLFRLLCSRAFWKPSPTLQFSSLDQSPAIFSHHHKAVELVFSAPATMHAFPMVVSSSKANESSFHSCFSSLLKTGIFLKNGIKCLFIWERERVCALLSTGSLWKSVQISYKGDRNSNTWALPAAFHSSQWQGAGSGSSSGLELKPSDMIPGIITSGLPASANMFLFELCKDHF